MLTAPGSVRCPGARSGSCNSGHRQPDLKAGITRLGSNLDCPMMFSDDPFHGVQSESSSLPDSLGGEERFIDMRHNFWRNSRTVVGDLDHHTVVVAIGAHVQLSLAAHGIDGIVDQVGPDLAQFTAKRIYGQRRLSVIAPDRYPVLQLVI